jgi:hypothetical protein
MNRQVVLAAVIAALSGCAAGGSGEDDAEVSSTASALVGGTASAEFNAIGFLSIETELDCTATLIGPRAIIAAGHCFAEVSNPLDAIPHALFLFANGNRTAEVLRIAIIGYDGEDDLAIAELGRDVSASAPDNTTPLPLAWEPPAGDVLRIFGYGCEDASIDQQTRMVSCTEGTSNAKRELALPKSMLGDLELSPEETGGRLVTTPADSGGPVIGGDDNAIWGIVSQTSAFHDADGRLTTRVTFGGVGWHRNDLSNALAKIGMFFN